MCRLGGMSHYIHDIFDLTGLEIPILLVSQGAKKPCEYKLGYINPNGTAVSPAIPTRFF